MLSKRETEHLVHTARTLLDRLPNTAAVDRWTLKTPEEHLAPVDEYWYRGYSGKYLSLIDLERGQFDLELWIETYRNYSRENALWFGLYSPRKSPIQELASALGAREWTDHQTRPPTSLVYDDLGRAEYYLGIYESKKGRQHEQRFVERCISLVNNVCNGLTPDEEATDVNAEVQRQRRLGTIQSRPEQRKFSKLIRRLYGRQCAVTGSSTPVVLEAAHIRVAADHRIDVNRADNAILLRADIHALFDRYLITLTRDGGAVQLSPELTDPSYDFLRTSKVARPQKQPPSLKNIAHHRNLFKKARGK